MLLWNPPVHEQRYKEHPTRIKTLACLVQRLDVQRTKKVEPHLLTTILWIKMQIPAFSQKLHSMNFLHPFVVFFFSPVV